MGAGASTHSEQLAAKSDLLSHEEVVQLYGDQFDEYIFSTLKNEDNLVKKSDVKNVVEVQMKLIAQTLLNATFAVFKHFTADTGDMKSRQFCDMCRAAKILNKTKFSSADASIFYEKILKSQRVAVKCLRYDMFKKDVVPALALKFEVEEDVIMSKFGGIVLPSEEIYDDTLREGGEGGGEVTEQESKAATKLQAITRQKSAAKEMEEMKQVMNTISEIKDDFFNYPTVGQPEAKILDVFCTHCVDGVATKFLLVKLLQKANILNKNRTIFDCKMAFLKTKLIAKSRPCYASGVIANKFVRYRVFREVLMPCLAERFQCSVEEILESLRRVESNNVEALSSSALSSQRIFFKGASKEGKGLRSSFSIEDPS